MLFERPEKQTLKRDGRTIVFRSCPADVGAERLGLFKAITGMARALESGARQVQITKEDFDQILSDIISYTYSVDDVIAKDFFGAKPRDFLVKNCTTIETLGLWVAWYEGTRMDDEVKGKSQE